MSGEQLSSQAQSGATDPAVSRFALVTLLLAPVIALALVLSITRSSLDEAALAPEEFWGGPLDSTLNTIHTFRTTDGMIGEFEHPSSASEIRIVLSAATAQPNREGLLSLLKRGEAAGYPKLFESYTTAFFNPRRTGPIRAEQIEIANTQVLIEQVEGLKGWHYSVLVMTGPNESMEVLSIRKNAATPLQVIKDVIEASPRLRAVCERM